MTPTATNNATAAPVLDPPTSTHTAIASDSPVAHAAILPLAPPPPPPRPAIVRVMEYYMNGIHMGTLYLLRRGNGTQQCAWCSMCTGVTTVWHGEWHQFPSGTTVSLFDFGGREDNRKHVAIYRDGKGSDYRGRAIQVVQVAFWQWDTAAEQYVRRS